MFLLSLDLGGTHIGCGVVRGTGLVASESLSADGAQSLASLLPLIERTIRKLLIQSGASERDCGGLALGFPGILHPRTGQILSTLKKYEDTPSLDLARWSMSAFGVPIRIENDARMALLGEQYAGAARGFTDVVMMTLGTGIGAAAMILGQPLRGAHGQAGCLGGHLPVDFRGRQCVCGAIGCAETEASGWSLPEIVRQWSNYRESELARAQEIDFRALFRIADAGDRVAIEVRQHCLAVWAANAVALVHAYDPDVLVIGGGVMNSAEVVLPYVQSYVVEHAWTAWGKTQVRAAELGENAALLGAVPLFTPLN